MTAHLVDDGIQKILVANRLQSLIQALSLNTRIKMNQSSRVFAVAMMGDGRVLYAAREIQVTLGGCGG